jgi:beta-1,4-mannooligosaccharide/beta-1,4-mannosyl-N-acetylglucosamine phosphorylase
MIYKEQVKVERHPSNPIITTADMPHDCFRVTNPAACKFGDEYILMYKVIVAENREQYIGIARSKDGVNFTVDPKPALRPAPDEIGRANDPRLTKHEDGWYYLTYCSDPKGNRVREEGIHLCIARTKDFENWERIYKSEPDNRNAVIFPEKIGGLYCRLDRPFARGYKKERGYDIWVSYSPDMEFWGKHKMVLSHLDVKWGSYKIGPGCQPIKTEHGWLIIFHGAESPAPEDEGYFPPWTNAPTKVYRAGLMMLDLEDPSKIVAYVEDPLMEITYDYERDPSYRPNVIFPGGIIVEPDGEVKIYYGAADTTVALATARLDDLIELCLRNKRQATKPATEVIR